MGLLLRRVDRYLVREILGPLALGLAVYTFTLLLQFLFNSAEMIIRRGIPPADVGRLLILTLPNVLALTVPMSFLFAILVTVGRLAADSELVAMRSLGISLFSLYRPILLVSLVLALANTYLMTTLLPAGNHALQQLRLELFAKSVSQQVEARVFYDEWPGLVLYVFETPDQRPWRGVFVAERRPGTESQVTIAESGRVRVDEANDRLILQLQGAVVHKYDFAEPAEYQLSSYRRMERVIQDRFTSAQQARVKASKGLREKTIPELRETLADSDLSVELRRLARVEIHKKFSIPAACLVFGLIGLPLGFTNPRSGKSASFVISIVVIIVYYILISNGEEAARVGKMAPWLAMWLPNLLLTVVGLFLLGRKNRDKSLLLGRLDRWARRAALGRRLKSLLTRWRRRRREETAMTPGGPGGVGASSRRADVLLRVPRFRLRFPNRLDRYVLRIFASVLLLVSFSVVSVFLIADLTETIDDILNQSVGVEVLWDYYKYLALQVTFELAPLVVLITTLVVFGLLSKTNEVTAVRALGTSLYRLSVPALCGALLVALFSTFLQMEVLPASNKKVARLKDEIKGRETARTYRRADRQWLFGQGQYIYNYLHYDGEEQALQRLQVFEFDSRHRLSGRLVTQSAHFVDDRWVFTEGWARQFDGARQTAFVRFSEPRIVDYPERPEYFESEVKPPDQMSYGELAAYIQELEAGGQSVPELEVELHKKVAFPAICVVMGLVALPFSFRLPRQGALYGLGVGIVLGMVLMALVALFSTLGEAGVLPPLLAVWSPNILFTILSVYLFLGVRT